jgi:hypothetical protein
MLKRKVQEELTTEDAPDSIAPWVMLEDDEIASLSVRARELVPERHFAAFARRIDEPHCACFDRGPEGKGKSVAVVNTKNGEIVTEFSGFTAWFDAALADSRQK